MGKALSIGEKCFAQTDLLFNQLPIMYIGIRAIPLDDLPRFVQQGVSSKEEPSKFSVKTSKARLYFTLSAFPD